MFCKKYLLLENKYQYSKRNDFNKIKKELDLDIIKNVNSIKRNDDIKNYDNNFYKLKIDFTIITYMIKEIDFNIMINELNEINELLDDDNKITDLINYIINENKPKIINPYTKSSYNIKKMYENDILI